MANGVTSVDTAFNKNVQIVRMVRPGSGEEFEFLALQEEEVRKENELPTKDAEEGFPATQFTRPQPHRGTLSAILVNNPIVSAQGNILGKDFESSVERGITKDDQKEALDTLWDVEDRKELIRLESGMESIDRCLIESVSYRRDERTNLYVADVEWQEFRVTETQSVAVKLAGRRDLATGKNTDAPPVESGDRTVGTESTSEDVQPKDEKDSGGWNDLMGAFDGLVE